jgi:hypothetical protein
VYEQLTRESEARGELDRAALMLEDAGFCHFRAAFQAQDEEGFKRLIELSKSAYNSAIELQTKAGGPASAARSALPPRDARLFRRKASDQADQWSRVLSAHGSALRQYAPNQYHAVLRAASLANVLAGRRVPGVAAGLASLHAHPLSAANWGTLLLSLAGPRMTRWALAARAPRVAACRFASR